MSKNAQDCLMAGFAMFSLKDPSLNQFRKNYPEREANLKRIYKLDSLPSDTTLRETIDGIKPEKIKAHFKPLINRLKKDDLLEGHKVLGDYIAISNDGTGQFCSCKIKCPFCLTKKRKNGEINYYHQLFASVIVSPNQKTVFPITAEPIVLQNQGDTKNDCELNASKRAIPAIREILPKSNYKVIMLYDGLYPNGPQIRKLKSEENDLNFITNIKEGYVFVQLDELEKEGELRTTEWEQDGKKMEFCYREDLMLNGENQDILVNFFEYRESDAETGEQIFYSSWITDLPVSELDPTELVAVARSRWKVENEAFNTLKNQGYYLEHNYGHGKKYLSTNFALLTLLAFLTDQMAQHCDASFQKALEYCETKKRLWEKVRQVFDLIPSMSMNVIYQFISKDIVLDIPLLRSD